MNNGMPIEFASHASPLPSSTWTSLSEEKRIANVKSAIQDFPGNETIEIKQAHIDGQVTIVLNNVMTASERGIFLLDLEKWIGSVVITSQLIEKYEPQIFRDYKNRISRFTDAGWSFSSFGGVERVRAKLEAFCHEEYNKEEYKREEHLKKCMESGSDLFNRQTNKKRINENFFPNDLLKLMKKNPTFYFGSNATI